MNAATSSGRFLAQPVVLTAPGIDIGSRSRARGLDALRWIGLVADGPAADHDELAFQSLTGDHYGDDPAHWIA